MDSIPEDIDSQVGSSGQASPSAAGLPSHLRSSSNTCLPGTGTEAVLGSGSSPSIQRCFNSTASLASSDGAEARPDAWEDLTFDVSSSWGLPAWALGDLRGVDASIVRSKMLELQGRLSWAMQEVDRLRGTVQDLAADAEGEPPEPLWRPAWDGFRRGFTLAYGVRAGLGVMTRALQLLRQRRWQEFHGWRLLSERGLVYREDAVRLGLFIGGFTSIYSLVHAVLARQAAKAPPGCQIDHGRACFYAGTLAGLTVIFQGRERRQTLSLYMAARVAQCWYNSLKASGRWHFFGSNWSHGDALLFALASAQVMYAYVMRPETLPRSYWNFIVRTGPIEAVVLEAVRHALRGKAVDVDKVNAYVSKLGGSRFLDTAFPRQVPSWILHPGRTPLQQIASATAATFRKTFPLYMSLSLVPFVVLNLKRALKSPLGTAWHALLGATRSTSFIAGFVGLYMATVSAHRRLFRGDTKVLYWFAGLVASATVLLEKKARRAELALYVLPRSVESVLRIMFQRRLLPAVRYGEVALFSLCMGAIMYFREHEPDTMAPFLKSLISRIVLGQPLRSSKSYQALPRPPSPRSASVTNLSFPASAAANPMVANLSVPASAAGNPMVANLSLPASTAADPSAANLSLPASAAASPTVANLSLPASAAANLSAANLSPPTRPSSSINVTAGDSPDTAAASEGASPKLDARGVPPSAGTDPVGQPTFASANGQKSLYKS